MLYGTLARPSFKCLDQDLNLDLDLRRVLCDPLHHRDVFHKHPDLESNQVQGFRKALCDPLHHRDTTTKADDWSCTSIEQFTKLLPRYSATSATKAGVQGFEPCGAALETASSPRRTLPNRPRPCGRGLRISQQCTAEPRIDLMGDCSSHWSASSSTSVGGL